VTITLILILVLFVAFSAFFSASETSMFSLSSMQVKAYGQSDHARKKLVASLLQRPADLLVTLLLLNTVINILIQNVVSSLLGEDSDWTLNVGIPLAITLIFGEVIPKSIGVYDNERISQASAGTIKLFEKIFYPIRFALTKITHWVTPWEFFFLKRQEQVSIEELRHALKTSHAEGVLSHDELELVRGYLNLEDASTKELMRPREEVLIYDLDEPLEKLVYLFVDQECSRIPICKGGLDQVIGIMDATTFFLYRGSIHGEKELVSLIKKPFFVPESLPARSLLRKFYERKESLALIVDEYSSISGLITLEDLVETVIGEISDRRDEKQRFTRSGQDTLIASGKMELAEIEKIFGVALESRSNMITIGGWLTEQMGDIPKNGAKFSSQGLYFHILASEPNRVRRVYIRHLKSGEKVL